MALPDWVIDMKRFEKIDDGKSLRELLNSILPYLAIFVAMCFAFHFGLPYWALIIMAIPAAGFLVRTFIILHDCGHYSYSNEPKLNSTFGYICGVLTFASFPDFRRSQAGRGDIPGISAPSGAERSRKIRPACIGLDGRLERGTIAPGYEITAIPDENRAIPGKFRLM